LFVATGDVDFAGAGNREFTSVQPVLGLYAQPVVQGKSNYS
jgi:hypothetical protein